MARFDSHETYSESCVNEIELHLRKFFQDLNSIRCEDIQKKIRTLNRYENLSHLRELNQDEILILDEDKLDLEQAEDLVLEGGFFWEHAAAGEATRLMLGTKYIIDMSKFSEQDLIEKIYSEAKEDFGSKFEEYKTNNPPEKILLTFGGSQKSLLPMTLGQRHMLQMTYDLIRLARKHGKDPKKVLAKQRTLIILNEHTADKIIKEFIRFDFFMLTQENVFFMIQKAFPGITIQKGSLQYDPESERHLYNHGNMVQQKLHENSIFRINRRNEKEYISKSDFKAILAQHKVMLSYNIEDIGYLTNSIDLPGISLALDLRKQGYNMIMEIVLQNPLKPQIGGAAFFDKKLRRLCMIESNRLDGLDVKNIKHLNRNFNFYINPNEILDKLEEHGLPLHLTAKNTKTGIYLYLCPPQGDLNFILKTAYIMRKSPNSIQNWKSAMTAPPTIAAMHKQDAQEGFKVLAEKIVLNA